MLAAGPHDWDFSKKINTEYPMCFDCHGNHDIGNPPADFKLAAMCGDCHDKLDKQFPNIAAVVEGKRPSVGRDAARSASGTSPRKSRFPRLSPTMWPSLRGDTMQAIHAAKEIPGRQGRRA